MEFFLLAKVTDRYFQPPLCKLRVLRGRVLDFNCFLHMCRTACGNPLVNDASPKLTPSAVGGTSLMPWDASTVVSRRSSPLVQRYSTGASAGRGTVEMFHFSSAKSSQAAAS